MTLGELILLDTRANQPAATFVPDGTLFSVTDEGNIIERSNGTTWESYSPAVVVGGITALTGDVTASGSGSVAATIANNAVITAKILDANVTLAKMANLAQDLVIGRALSAGTGVPTALTRTQLTALLNAFTSSLQGAVPASGGGTTNFLRADGTWTTPSAGSTGWTVAGKTADQSSVNNTPIADTELRFTMLASKIYAFKLRAWIRDPSTPLFLWAFTGPASPTLLNWSIKYWNPGSGSLNALSVRGGTSYPAAVNVPNTGGSGASDFGALEIDGMVQNGTNAGDFIFNWSQNTTDAGNPTVLRGGSTLEYRQLN